MDNIASNVYAKFDDDRLWNEKVLVHKLLKRTSDNKNPNSNNDNNKNNNVRSWPLGPFSGSEKFVLSLVLSSYLNSAAVFKRLHSA